VARGETEPLRIPAPQRGLSAVVHNARWLEALTAAAVWDQAHATDKEAHPQSRDGARRAWWWPSRSKRVPARGWRLRGAPDGNALTAPGLTQMIF